VDAIAQCCHRSHRRRPSLVLSQGPAVPVRSGRWIGIAAATSRLIPTRPGRKRSRPLLATETFELHPRDGRLLWRSPARCPRPHQWAVGDCVNRDSPSAGPPKSAGASWQPDGGTCASGGRHASGVMRPQSANRSSRFDS
jgi:hypothetical protein